MIEMISLIALILGVIFVISTLTIFVGMVWDKDKIVHTSFYISMITVILFVVIVIIYHLLVHIDKHTILIR
jgi:hypothetical protein